MITINGYSDVLSAGPGETIEFKVSSKSPRPFAAELVRVIHADPNPAGPGMRFERLGQLFAGTFASVDSPLTAGLIARVNGVPAAGSAAGLTAAGARIRADCTRPRSTVRDVATQRWTAQAVFASAR